MNPFTLQAILAFALPKVIEWMKGSSLRIFSFVEDASPASLKRTVNAAVAFLAAAGVTATKAGSLFSLAGATVSVHLSVPALLTAVATFLTQYAGQHVFYEAFWKKLTAPGNPIPKA